MNIQLSGLSQEIQQFLAILSSSPCISITRESRELSNGKTQCVRRFVEIEFMDNDCPKIPGTSEKGDAQ